MNTFAITYQVGGVTNQKTFETTEGTDDLDALKSAFASETEIVETTPVDAGGTPTEYIVSSMSPIYGVCVVDMSKGELTSKETDELNDGFATLASRFDINHSMLLGA